MSANTFLPGTPVGPTALLISAITQTSPMVITIDASTPPYNYIVGQLVALTVPFDYGMYQANGLTAEIIAVNSLDLTVNVSATQFDAFVAPAMYTEMPASLASAGSRNTYNFTTLPYHSLTNTGN